MDFNVYVLERLIEDRMAEARRTAARIAMVAAGRKARAGRTGGTLARLVGRILAARGGATAAKAPTADRRGWARSA